MLETTIDSHQDRLDGLAHLKTQMTFRISVLSKLLDRQMTAIAAAHGLSLGAYRMLATITAFREISAADLVRFTGYDKAQVSRMINELIRDGHVTVRDDPGHGRRRLLRGTEAGQALLDAAAPAVEARRAHLSATLSEAEEKVLLKAIDKLSEAARDPDGPFKGD